MSPCFLPLSEATKGKAGCSRSPWAASTCGTQAERTITVKSPLAQFQCSGTRARPPTHHGVHVYIYVGRLHDGIRQRDQTTRVLTDTVYDCLADETGCAVKKPQAPIDHTHSHTFMHRLDIWANDSVGKNKGDDTTTRTETFTIHFQSPRSSEVHGSAISEGAHGGAYDLVTGSSSSSSSSSSPSQCKRYLTHWFTRSGPR